MTEKMTLDAIRQFWTDQASKHGLSSDASWSDRPVIEMEIKEISKWLTDGDQVLDVGCANGFSTFQFALHKRLHIQGVDYIPEMIESANLRRAQAGSKLVGEVQFAVDNILSLNAPDETYDKVIVIRVLINLGDWARQQKGLRECTRVLKKGGLLILSEATLQGWKQLNKFRDEWELPPIQMPPFNNYLDQDAVVQAVSGEFDLVEISNFASTYYVGTRIIKPLVIQALGRAIDVADPNMEWNRWFAQLPPTGDYGVQKLFVLRKKK